MCVSEKKEVADAAEEGRKIIFLCGVKNKKKSSVIVHLMFGIFFCNLLEEEKTIINPVCRTNKETTIKTNQNKYSGGGCQ